MVERKSWQTGAVDVTLEGSLSYKIVEVSNKFTKSEAHLVPVQRPMEDERHQIGNSFGIASAGSCDFSEFLGDRSD